MKDREKQVANNAQKTEPQSVPGTTYLTALN